ncbi:carboxypeptidase M32 [Eubacteriales bacterium KG127]
MMNLNDAKKKMMEIQAKTSAYQHALACLYYDGVTVAPKGTSDNRAHTVGILSEELYKHTTSPETIGVLDFLEENKAKLDEIETRMLFLLRKELEFVRNIPMDEYIAYQSLLVESEDLWHKAKEASDFGLFEDALSKVFETTKKFAGYCAPYMDPYDYWLNEFEEGASKASCDEFFAALRKEIVPLIEKIKSVPQIEDNFLYGDFEDKDQEKLAYYLMETMGIDFNHCGLGTTEHPFTESLGSHKDVRITTNYQKDMFTPSMYSVIHEGGHALYDMHSDPDFAYTVLDGGVSMGIHESQSRFYENILGRSREFIKYIFPKLVELFPEVLDGRSEEDLYKAINRVDPSLIRIEADEITYALHIMIRYELEKKIMAGDLSVHDLPMAWNELYKEYLGVDVPDDKHGVLQDSHWAGGAIGYFPSYALGSAYGAQLLAKMKEDIDVESALQRGDFEEINKWNEEHIWKYGKLYTPNQLLEKALGTKFSPDYFITYLKEKYSDIYGL